MKKKLQEILNSDPHSIRGYVAEEALHYSAEDCATFFHDILCYGCISGMVSWLIYYKDTHRFFDMYYHEIDELREEFEDSTGEPLQIKGDLKNMLARFAFEETAYRMACEMGLEV